MSTFNTVIGIAVSIDVVKNLGDSQVKRHRVLL